MFELREVDGYMGALQCLIPFFYNSAAQTNKSTDQSLNLISTELIYKKLDSDTCIFFFKIQRKRQKMWSLQRTLDSHVILAVDILVVQWNLRFNSRYLFLLLWMMSTKIRYVLKMHSSFSFVCISIAITMLRKVNTKTKNWIQVVTVNRNGPMKYSSKTWSWRLLRPV